MTSDGALVSFLVIGGWIVSLCFHEFGHGIVAYIGGDKTIKEKGYLSFNPFAYTDVGLSIVLPTIFVLLGGIGLPGAAVIVDHSRLRSKIWSSLVAAAGPFFTLAFALFLVGCLPLFKSLPDSFLYAASFLLVLEYAVLILNLLPVPGLDGFGIISPFLSEDTRRRLLPAYKYGFLILIAALWMVPVASDLLWGTAAFMTRASGIEGQWIQRGYELYREGAVPFAIVVITVAAIVFAVRRQTDWRKKAEKLIKEEKFQQAIDLLEGVLAKKSVAEAWWLKAFSSMCLSQKETITAGERAIYQAQASEALRRYAALDQDSPLMWFRHGLINQTMNNAEGAAESYEKALRLKPDFLEALNNLAMIYQEQNRYEKLLACVNQYLERDPKRADVIALKAIAQFNLGEYEEAIKSLDRCIDLKHEIARSWYNEACCYARLGKIDDAVGCLEQIAKLNDRSLLNQARSDQDLSILHNDPRFQKLAGAVMHDAGGTAEKIVS